MAVRGILPFLLGLSFAAAAHGETKRQLDAHEHGHGTLNMVIEGNTVHMELEVAGHDIVGFEHAASTNEQKASLANGLAQLKKPQALFGLPGDAQCAVSSVKVEHETGDEHAGSHSGSHDHGHKSHGHAHDKKEHKAESGERHSEFHGEYTFQCKNPGAIRVIAFPFFEAFGNAGELTVTLVTARGQKVYDVSRSQPKIDLQGMM